MSSTTYEKSVYGFKDFFFFFNLKKSEIYNILKFISLFKFSKNILPDNQLTRSINLYGNYFLQLKVFFTFKIFLRFKY